MSIRTATARAKRRFFPQPISAGPAGLRHLRAHPRARARALLHRRDGRRRLRDGGPAQLGRRLVQDLCAAAVEAAALCHRQGRGTTASASPSRRRQRLRRAGTTGHGTASLSLGAPVGRMPSISRCSSTSPASAACRRDDAPQDPDRAARSRNAGSAAELSQRRRIREDRAALASPSSSCFPLAIPTPRRPRRCG